MPDTDAQQKSTLNRPWVLKMLIFIIVLLAFGSWGLYDAAIKYPANGARFAEWAEWQYLQKARDADAEELGYFSRYASVPDPRQELEHLSRLETDQGNREAAENTQSLRRLRAIAELTRRQWLEGLQVIGKMTPERTTIADPRARLDELAGLWGTRPQPAALHWYDIPVQWAIMIGCYAMGLYLIVLFLRVASKRYRWEPAEQRLTFPGGASIVPDDLAEIDKRKWDKFIVFLKIREGHEKLGGREIRVDTYRHALVEGWILEMEKTRFPPEEDGDEQDSGEKQDASGNEAGDDAPDDADDRA
ncbi:MAG: hypothetical protein R3B57_13520 [Phycisphaerales bacterium]